MRNITLRLALLAIVTALSLTDGHADTASVATVESMGQPLFARGQDGYHTFRIPALAVTTKGTVLAFAEGRKKSGGDAGKMRGLGAVHAAVGNIAWFCKYCLHDANLR